MEGQPKPPPSPFSIADSGRVRAAKPDGEEDPGVKKTRLWVELLRTLLVPLVTAGVTFLGTSLYSDAGNSRVKRQAEAKIEAQRRPTNATVDEVTQLRTEMGALAEAVQRLTKAQTPARRPHVRGEPARAPDPAPAKAKAEAVQVLQAITDRIADAPPLPKAPPASAPPPPPVPAAPQK